MVLLVGLSGGSPPSGPFGEESGSRRVEEPFSVSVPS